MGRRHYDITDEILEIIAETIGETSCQVDCWINDRIAEIDGETSQTIQLTDRIQERYTIRHSSYYQQTIDE